MRHPTQEVHETNSEMAASLEKHIDDGDFTNPSDCFFWMLGYAFERETGTRIMEKIHAAEDKAGGLRVAAAPDLLAALKALCTRIDDEGASPLDWHEYDAAVELIAKAEGRQ